MPIVSSELQGTEKHCSFRSGKGELLVKIKVRACNLLALVNKDSVGILRGFLLEGAYLSGAKKLHSSWAACKLKFAGVTESASSAQPCSLRVLLFCKDVHELPGV